MFEGSGPPPPSRPLASIVEDAVRKDDSAPARSLDEWIGMHPELADSAPCLHAQSLDELCAGLAANRVGFLARLRESGVTSLQARQRIANTLGRDRREGRICLPGETPRVPAAPQPSRTPLRAPAADLAAQHEPVSRPPPHASTRPSHSCLTSEAHADAERDVMACIRILSHLTHNAWCLVGPIYPTYATSLRSVRWIGRKAEQLLYLANIRSVEDLFTHIHHNIRNDYIVHSISEDASVRKTLGIIFKNELPEDNIANITTVINGMRAIRPYSYTFMIMQH